MVQTIVGFGGALILMPMLTLLVGLKVASPLVAMIATTMHMLLLSKGWRLIRMDEIRTLVLSSLLGVPIGSFLIAGSFETPMKLLLGIFIIGFAGYRLSSKSAIYRIQNARLGYIFGLLGGVLGGAFNANGPAIVAYASMRNWDPRSFVPTLQGYFLPVGLFVLLGHYLSGLWTSQVFNTYAIALPGVALGLLAGKIIRNRITQGGFDKFVYMLLIVTGGALLLEILSNT